ncbi:MFS transporter [Paenibacillus sp. MMS18-CY102]|uniref:MFS transporter n=1 Tax=Paenibacillus sp. MMS18-CY102 TaxID=2682849 RepID=UPI001365DA37|nr:MFS transporter [Paenibacillus sp. MMS18-CY102]MWC29775.1 MFS transporter [Paenibacillus sp. MMS18-CY102]
MSKEMKKLLAMNTVSSIIAIYIGLFVNLYLWEQTHSIAELSLYNLSMFVSWGIAFTATAKLLTRFTIRLPLGVSAVCGGIAFAYLQYAHLEPRWLWIIVLGVPIGAMFGFSTAAQNLSIALSGKSSELSPYFAAISIIGQVLSIAVPFIAAKAIDGFGYGGSFALMLVFLTLMLVFSAFMPRMKLPAPQGEAERADHGKFRFRLAFGQPGAKWMLLSMLAAGIFLQFQNLFTLLFTFSVTENKVLIALLNMLYTLSAIGGLWVYRKCRISENRWLWIGAALLAVGFIIVLFRHPIALVASNVLTAVGMFYFTTVWNAQQFRFIKPAGAIRQTSFLVWRENILVATRCVLLVLTFQLSELHGVWFVMIISFTVCCLMLIPLFQHLAFRARGE